jgi:hypothetical protein
VTFESYLLYKSTHLKGWLFSRAVALTPRLVRNGEPSLRDFLSFCDSSADSSDARGLWRRVLRGEMGSKYDRGRIEVNRHHAGIFECILSGYSPSKDVTHRHSAAPRPDSRRYLGIMRDVSRKVKHHLQHESATLPEPALCLHGFEPLR